MYYHYHYPSNLYTLYTDIINLVLYRLIRKRKIKFNLGVVIFTPIYGEWIILWIMCYGITVYSNKCVNVFITHLNQFIFQIFIINNLFFYFEGLLRAMEQRPKAINGILLGDSGCSYSGLTPDAF